MTSSKAKRKSSAWKRKPKFRIGQKVSYRTDQRIRRTIRAVYWDPRYPGYRYQFVGIDDCWAIIEDILVPR